MCCAGYVVVQGADLIGDQEEMDRVIPAIQVTSLHIALFEGSHKIAFCSWLLIKRRQRVLTSCVLLTNPLLAPNCGPSILQEIRASGNAIPISIDTFYASVANEALKVPDIFLAKLHTKVGVE